MTGAVVCDSAVLEEDVEIGHNAVVLSGAEPRRISRICRRAVIGSNATICEGVTVGYRAQVRPGSVVKQSVPPLAIVDGNPARIIGYVETRAASNNVQHTDAAQPASSKNTSVRGVTLHRLMNVKDLRGSLSAGEAERQIPFQVRRYFLVYDVPTSETRGEHAHRNCHQFLVAANGKVRVIADDGRNREEFTLDHPSLGLYLPPMTWGIQYCYSRDAVLLVFASDHYDPADYIRDYENFLSCSDEPQ